MKTLAQYVYAVAAVGGVLLASGCATTDPTSTGPRFGSSRQVGPTSEFTVIESSFGRELSAQEMSQLRDGVTKYLESQGVSPAGEYYVRVNFPPEQPEGTGAWVVVKVTRLPASTYTLIAAYPAIGPDDYYPYAFAYNEGFGYGELAYGYYDPQIYYPTNYHPRPFPLTPHRHDDGDKRKGDKDDHPRGGTPAWYDGPRDHPAGNSPRNYHPDGPRGTPRTDRGGTSSGHQNSSPRSSSSGGSRSFSPASSQSSGGSSFSAPPAPVSAPASSSAPAVSSHQNDRTQQN